MGKDDIEGQADRRAASRSDRMHCVRVHGRNGSYDAVLLNFSYRDSLFAITDPNFAAPPPGQLDSYARRVGFQFHGGIHLKFLDEPVTIRAEVVRIEEGADAMPQIACVFHEPLADDQCKRLGVEPPTARERAVFENSRPASFKERPPIVEITRDGDDEGVPLAVEGTIHDLMTAMVPQRATDLHIKAGAPPRIRVDGEIQDVGTDLLSVADAASMVRDLLTPDQFERFNATGDLDLACSIDGSGRFRVNVLRQRGRMGLAIRRIPEKVPTLDSLRLSPLCKVLADSPRGLVLVTGPTGSGKSTTLAAMVHHVNKTRRCHIVTMEDPIEYVHNDIRAHVTQREIGRDTPDFSSALKRALRQDPDVILVGEMRDLETIGLAITAAATGHLVFGTLHTTSAAHTVDRMVDVFPPPQQTQIRMQLSDALQGVISQGLLPRINGGVVAAQEILVATDAVRALIREGKAHQITNFMQTGGKKGMQTLEAALNDLVARKLIIHDIALAHANHPQQIRQGGQRSRSTVEV